MRDRSFTVPEALAASLVTVLSAVIVVSYLWARVGRLSPFAMLGFAVATAVVLSIALIRRAIADAGALAAATGIVALVTGWLLWLARPGLLPPSGHGDLAHHLMLVDYIERHWQLPDASVGAAMGEMAHYTPGLHLLTTLLGAWTGTDGLRVIYPLVVSTVAVKAALVLLIALRVLSDTTSRIPLGVTAIVLLLLPQEYVLGAFLQESFLAQVAGELFAVAMWWSLVVWDSHPSRVSLLLFAATGAGAFLTWPIWIGPPIVALVATVLTRDDMTLGVRVRNVCVAIAPVAGVAMLHAIGRVGWLGMAGTTGAVVRPSVNAIGWPFLVLAIAGLVLSIANRQLRATRLLTLAIVAQSLSLFAVAQAQGASTPYMALKMMYLLIYPLAVFGAVALATVWQRIDETLHRRANAPRYARQAVIWALLAATLVVYRKPLTTPPRTAPVVSLDLYNAGRWARANLEAACVDYLVPHPDTMYWLHLAVLGNSRTSLRTADPTTFDPARAIARWIQPGGLPYGIADLRTLPREVLGDVDILEQFRTAAVVRRRGPASCPDAVRFALLHAIANRP